MLPVPDTRAVICNAAPLPYPAATGTPRHTGLLQDDVRLREVPHLVIQCNNLARARQKLNAGADVNHEEDPHVRNTPLETAIWQDQTEMVELLLEFGADPNQQDESHYSQN